MMGFWHSKLKHGEKPDDIKILNKPKPTTDNPEDAALARIRRTLAHDLETFLLNNILLSVQFFENFEREMGNLRVGPTTEYNAELAEHKRHCLTTNNLYELVAKHVLFRTQHGERSHRYEHLHMRRLYIVHDNVEVVQNRDSLDYSSPCYRFILEKAQKHRPGYVKLRVDESSFPERRRVTYETIEEDEGVYTWISSDSARETDNSEDVSKAEHEALQGIPLSTASTNASNRKTSTKVTKKAFGPQNPELEKSETPFTPIERRLSGIIKSNKQDNKNFLIPPKTKFLSPAQSLTDLSLPSSSSDRGDKSIPSSKNSSNSSGYKSEGESPSRKYQSPARSYSSDSDYGYTTITELMKPKPLIQHRLGHIPQNSSQIPKECFTTKEVPIYDDERGKNKLFDTRYYISSITFMRSFADIFSEKLAHTLGFTGALESATLQGTKIFCDTEAEHDSKPIKIQNEIIPTILSNGWPHEAQKWKTRYRELVATTPSGTMCTWPTHTMIDYVERLGCHLVPQGYLPIRGINNEQYLEWQLAFPGADRYLEMCLTHSQTRCLLFCLSLYKTFLEPFNTHLAFHPTYFRTLLFWECEHNFARWPEDRPGETLTKFLLKMYDSLKVRNLSDYFIRRRNVFESTPGAHLARVQEKLKRIIENPVMHLLIALRNLHYVDSSFYPVLDYKKLYEIITTDNLAGILNPQIKATIKPKLKFKEEVFDEADDDEDNPNIDLRKKFKKKDPQRKWNEKVRKQIEVERAARKLVNPPPSKQRRESADSIDILLEPGKGAENLKKKMILELFISHFIEIAKKSNLFHATRQAQFYLQHTERLIKLLREIEAGGDRMSYTYALEIKNIRHAMETFSDRQVPTHDNKTKQFKRNLLPSANDSTKSILKKTPKTQLTTKVEVHKPKARPSNPNITIVIPESVPHDTAISVDEVVTEDSTDF